MGITATVYAVSAADMDRILATPELANELWTCQVGSRDAAKLPRREYYLDKAWEAVTFMLGGQRDRDPGPPFDFVMYGGTPIGDLDTGMGPVRCLRGDDLVAIAALFEVMDDDACDRAFDHARMVKEDIYAIASDEADARDYVVNSYIGLRELVLTAARDGECLVLSFG